MSNDTDLSELVKRMTKTIDDLSTIIKDFDERDFTVEFIIDDSDVLTVEVLPKER